ncbi:MAG: Hsp70 family protein, partial [Oscillospiraceae bacterium]|nr:Hsp70 family protein [Oscillospiraceae bacterium]
VRFCGFIDVIASAFNSDIEFPELSRDVFEDMFQDYLCRFTGMINDCFDDAGFDKSKLDYVILTGGHSQWYFAEEILTGKQTKFGRVGLDKIASDKSRVIRLSKPQETVALGLVYQPININARAAAEETEDAPPFCRYCGARKAASGDICPNCGDQIPGAEPEFEREPPRQAYQGSNVNTNVVTGPNVYTLPAGKNIDGAAQAVNSFLSGTKNMETQVVNNSDWVAIQARAKGGVWKQFLGMDKALTVRINQVSANQISVDIGEAKWADKIGAMAVGMFVTFGFLAVTSGIGMYMQRKLPGEIKNVISMYASS